MLHRYRQVSHAAALLRHRVQHAMLPCEARAADHLPRSAACLLPEPPESQKLEASWSLAALLPRLSSQRGSAASFPRLGLRLSARKTRVCHIDEGFDFLGWRIQRQSWQGRPGKRALYTYPSKKALRAVMAKVRSLTRRNKHRKLAGLLRAANRLLQGWCAYFRHGVSARTFGYLNHYLWWRIYGWLCKRHVGLNRRALVRRFLPRWEIRDGQVELFRPARVPINRYRYRETHIPSPWASKAA